MKNSETEEMVTTTIKTERPPTQSELVNAIKGSMGPIFEHFEEKLLEGGGKQLDISITAKGGHLSLSYGIGEIILEGIEE